jgi:hypothetical protein
MLPDVPAKVMKLESDNWLPDEKDPDFVPGLYINDVLVKKPW